MNITPSLLDRYWPKVEVKSYAECWPWKAAINEFGYGRMTAGRGVNLKAHRVAYTIQYGAIPDGKCVLHQCDNPPCCNPFHLFLGTKKDNTQDMRRKGRGVNPPIHCGERHPQARLSDAQVALVRADKRPAHVIAKEWGTSTKFVYRVRHGETRCT